MRTKHEVLLYYTKSTLAILRTCLKHLYKLQREIYFLIERQSVLSKHFDNIEFIYVLIYLTDIFSHLNVINASIHGQKVTIMNTSEKINASVNKVSLLKKKFQSEN